MAHPNLFVFLGHLQRTVTDCETKIVRVSRGIMIYRRGKKRANDQPKRCTHKGVHVAV